MNEDLILTLQNYWFSEKEAKIYLTALSMWTAPASSIARNANESRTTVYSVLWDLVKKWFCSTVVRENVTYFSAVDPEMLVKIQEQKYEKIKEKLPEFMAIWSMFWWHTKIKTFEWNNALKNLFLELATTEVDVKLFQWWMDLDDYPHIYPEEESKSVIINENIINDVKETTSTEEWKILSETNLESIRNAVNHYMEHWIIIYNAKNVDDIINKIKYKIYRKSGISTKNWWKEDFLNNNNWIEIEKADIPTQYEAWDKFQVYCASALTSWFITVEIKWKENDNVNDEDNVNTEDNINTEDNWEIVQLHLSKSVIDELQTIKTDIENIFNHDEFLINDFVNSFINLRGIWFKSLIEEYRRWLPLQEYYKNSWWNDLYKYLTDMYFEKYEWIAEITRKLWKIITNLQQQSLLCFEEIKKILLKNNYQNFNLPFNYSPIYKINQNRWPSCTDSIVDDVIHIVGDFCINQIYLRRCYISWNIYWCRDKWHS